MFWTPGGDRLARVGDAAANISEKTQSAGSELWADCDNSHKIGHHSGGRESAGAARLRAGGARHRAFAHAARPGLAAQAATGLEMPKVAQATSTTRSIATLSLALSFSESARDNMKGLLSLGFMRVLKRPAFLPFGLYRLRFMKVLEVYVGFNVF